MDIVLKNIFLLSRIILQRLTGVIADECHFQLGENNE